MSKVWDRRDMNTGSWWENLQEGDDLEDLEERNILCIGA
jgi:hypothetical protein